MIRLIAIAAAGAALLLAGCGDDDDDENESSAPPVTAAAMTTGTAPAQPAAKGTAIAVSDSDYGRILFDGDDRAIYLFDKETGARSECYGACAEAWPPVLTDAEPHAGAGADQALLGTTKRDDGTTQVTYDGRPLYYYVDDPPGQVLCQNIEEFGGLWLVVRPNGEPARGG